MLNKKTVDDLTGLQGKKVLVRCDFNVPLKEGVIQNYNRIDGAIPTIKKLLDQGAKVILCSHLGKPKGEPLPELSLAPVAPALSERLGVEVKFVDDPKVTGPETEGCCRIKGWRSFITSEYPLQNRRDKVRKR